MQRHLHPRRDTTFLKEASEVVIMGPNNCGSIVTFCFLFPGCCEYVRSHRYKPIAYWHVYPVGSGLDAPSLSGEQLSYWFGRADCHFARIGAQSVKVLPKKSDPEFRDGLLATPQIHLAMQLMARRTPAARLQNSPLTPRQASRQRCAAECCSQLRTRRSSLVTGGFGRLPSNTCRWKSWWPSSPSWLRQKGSRWLPSALQTFWKMGIRPFAFFPRVGEPGALHPVNVMVLSLLLGKALGMKSAELHDLGVAALLHDIGKVGMPLRVAFCLTRHDASRACEV